LPKTLEQIDAEERVDLKDPALAAFLAWLIPGLGHLYQGRLPKAALFFVCIMGTFAYGVYLGGSSGKVNGKEIGWGRSVYFSWREGDKRLPYICQIGVGLPAMPALIQAKRMSSGKEVWWNGFMAPPRMTRVDRQGQPIEEAAPGDSNADQPSHHELHKALHRYLELGMAYTMIAGLLNVLAIYDAWGGPVFSEIPKRKEEGEEEEEEKPDAQ
jgi:hypothetical protein